MDCSLQGVRGSVPGVKSWNTSLFKEVDIDEREKNVA